MGSNIPLFIIFASFLTGVGSIFMAVDFSRQAEVFERTAVSVQKQVGERRGQLSEAQEALMKTKTNTLEQKSQARKNAIELEAVYTAEKDLSERKARIEALIEMNKTAKQSLDQLTGKLKDDIQTDIASIERALEEVGNFYTHTQKELENKSQKLEQSNQESKKEHELSASILRTDIEKVKNELNRSFRAVNSSFERAYPLGEVLEVVNNENLVVIDLGASAGIKPNFKFEVFSQLPNGDRINKGSIVVREVNQLVSIGRIEYKSEGQNIVQGDSYGNPAFRIGGRTFYLAGEFRGEQNIQSKFTREEYIQYLEYYGNKIAEELNYNVDMLVQGQFADRELAQASLLGITAIKDTQISPFLGD